MARVGWALERGSELARWRGEGGGAPQGEEQRLESKRELEAFEEVNVVQDDGSIKCIRSWGEGARARVRGEKSRTETTSRGPWGAPRKGSLSISNAGKGLTQRDKITFTVFKVSIWLLCEEWISGDKDC